MGMMLDEHCSILLLYVQQRAPIFLFLPTFVVFGLHIGCNANFSAHQTFTDIYVNYRESRSVFENGRKNRPHYLPYHSIAPTPQQSPKIPIEKLKNAESMQGYADLPNAVHHCDRSCVAA